MDDYNNNYNPYGTPEQPQQPDYASQYNQQPQQPDYASQYNQQPQQPDYSSQYNQQTDYSQQYNQYNQANNNYSQQPYQPQPMNSYTPDNGDVISGAAKAFTIVSFVCGIVSLVTCYFAVGFLPGVAAIVFSILAKKKYSGRNVKATLGLIFGIIGVVIASIIIIVLCVGAAKAGKSYTSSYRYYY